MKGRKDTRPPPLPSKGCPLSFVDILGFHVECICIKVSTAKKQVLSRLIGSFFSPVVHPTAEFPGGRGRRATDCPGLLWLTCSGSGCPVGVGGKLLPPPPRTPPPTPAPGSWPCPQSTIPAEKSPYLKDGEEGLGEVIECAPPGLHLIKVELPPKELHAQEGEDDDEEEE